MPNGLRQLNHRLDTYLSRLAARDWGTPSGFGGRTCFQAIAPLELERRGREPGVFRWEWIDYSLDLLRNRKDCQDFSMVGLLRILYRYADSRLLTPEHRSQIESVMLAAKYDMHDPGDDTCCWHTENHQVQYASSELLLGQRFPEKVFSNTGKIGAWHRERAREKLYLWLDWRLRFSFSEWNSSCYYDEDAAALLDVAEHAEDPMLRRRSRDVLELLLFHVALNSWHGLTGASQGRAYLQQQVEPDSTSMAILAQLCWGDDDDVPNKLSLGVVLLAAGEVRPSPAIMAVGKDNPSEVENRERHGLDADEAPAFGVYPDRMRDLAFFQGAGQASHHLVADTRYADFGGKAKWPGFFADREYYARCKAQGLEFDTWALPHATGHADLYTFRTPDYMLGCAQAYHPGAPGYQQFIWSALLGRRAVIFTTNPTPANIPYGRPGPWIGNGVLPKVVQHRNVLIALHRVRPVPIYDQPPWHREDRVHAWFPRGAFDEIVERNGWCFGRKGESYASLRADKPAQWLAPEAELAKRIGSDEPYEWNVDDTDVAWICELGARRTHGEFSEFIDAVSSAKIEGGIERFAYDSPSVGRIETGWTLGLEVSGQAVNIRDYPRFDNPYCQAPFGTRSMVIRCGGEECRIGE